MTNADLGKARWKIWNGSESEWKVLLLSTVCENNTYDVCVPGNNIKKTKQSHPS